MSRLFKYCIWLFCFVSLSNHALAQNKNIVYQSGTEGYRIFRIPAIIRYKKELLAFAEGRVKGGADFGDIDIVLKKSKDGGKTWAPLQVVASYDTLQAGNPAPVVDYSDPLYPEGRIFLFFNTGNQSESAIRNGKGLREVWYQTSKDGGESWEKLVNISSQVHKPNQPSINANYQFVEDWRSYANTPGHAIQFESGIYLGRIYVSANHSQGNPVNHFEEYRSHGYYSDDHGQTFQLASSVDIPGSNEAMSVALSGNRLMMNIRNQQGDRRERIVAISKNGGKDWDTTYFDQQLPDPVCQGSILAIGKKNGKPILAFCNAADKQKRDKLTLRISTDEGMHWQKSILIDQSIETYKGDYSAYSDMVLVKKNAIGILYEKDNYQQIVFAVYKWK